MQLKFAPNRRQHPRVSLVGLIRFQSPQRSYSGYLVNISQGGLMFKARVLPRPDEEIILTFQLLLSPYTYELRGVVVWVAQKTDPESPRGMGVRFVDLDSRDEKQIAEYISKH